jgi:subtilisin
MSDQRHDANSPNTTSARTGARRPAAPLHSSNAGPDATSAAIPAGQEITTRRMQYIIGPTQAVGLSPMASDTILTALQATPHVQIDGFIQLSRTQVFAAGGLGGRYVKASMPLDQGLLLQRQAAAAGTLFVQENARLQHMSDSMPLAAAGAALPAPAVATAAVPVTVRVVGSDGRPVANAMVSAYGAGFVQAATDATGLAMLTFFGGTPDALAALYVKPFADYWERWIPAPSLRSDGENLVRLQPLESWPGANLQPGQSFFGWGERLMGLLPVSQAEVTGRGVRVAIIDSGCDTNHPALSHIGIGLDLTNRDATNHPDPNTWRTDIISHGTHCAGVIAGNGTGGIRGFAPKAEVHILKLFPGGAFDSLIEALVYCIDHDIDVVNCSLGSDQINEGVIQQMMLARQAGMIVVVAAGNSGGPVQFPARLPTALCVSALGQAGTFPPDTYHAQTAPSPTQPGVTAGINGLFAPKFTCRGPEVRLCGPGVAIISSVPGGGHTAMDGTSMGAPHITGLTAVVAAHHPLVAGMTRNASRADQVLQLVMSVAQPVGMDAHVVGAGIPLATAEAAPTSNLVVVPQANAGPDASDLFRQLGLGPVAAANDLQSKVSHVVDDVLARWRVANRNLAGSRILG